VWCRTVVTTTKKRLWEIFKSSWLTDWHWILNTYLEILNIEERDSVPMSSHLLLKNLITEVDDIELYVLNAALKWCEPILTGWSSICWISFHLNVSKNPLSSDDKMRRERGGGDLTLHPITSLTHNLHIHSFDSLLNGVVWKFLCLLMINSEKMSNFSSSPLIHATIVSRFEITSLFFNRTVFLLLNKRKN
jgi:hypothetical protein